MSRAKRRSGAKRNVCVKPHKIGGNTIKSNITKAKVQDFLMDWEFVDEVLEEIPEYRSENNDSNA